MDKTFDRSTEDLGNIAGLEHVNLRMDNQHLANQFYVVGLGLTRDPYINVADNNMWINVGRSQFHLPTGQPMRLRGHAGLIISEREALLRRLSSVKKSLDGTCFAFHEEDGFVAATCPWGNQIRCYEPDRDRFGHFTLGMAYVEFDVPVGTASGIANFYTTIFDARAHTDGDTAHVVVGKNQQLVFRETEQPLPPFDGHHIQVYLVNFAAPHQRLKERGLIKSEDGQYQYRFQEIVDPDDGRPLYTIEHEVRSMTHPMQGRPLVNRNPNQTPMDYKPGQDPWLW
jgi:hypothetical protein